MERVVTKVDAWSSGFKSDLETWLSGARVTKEGVDATSELVEYIRGYDKMVLSEADFQKRKRTLTVPLGERCQAKRSNNEQCSRRRKGGGCYCGTHAKGQPFGEVLDGGGAASATRKVDIRTLDVEGVYYYVDGGNNVYSPEDIVKGVANPRVIGVYGAEGATSFTMEGAEGASHGAEGATSFTASAIDR